MCSKRTGPRTSTNPCAKRRVCERSMLFTDLGKKGLKPVAGAQAVTGAVSCLPFCRGASRVLRVQARRSLRA